MRRDGGSTRPAGARRGATMRDVAQRLPGNGRRPMRHLARPVGTIAAALIALSVVMASAQARGTADEHLAKGRAASGKDFGELIGVTCDLVRPPAAAAPATPAAPAPAGPPARATWHAEPAKVFDNVYFV